MNNLEPRAKIGDVVIVKEYWTYDCETGVDLMEVNKEFEVLDRTKIHSGKGPVTNVVYDSKNNFFYNKDILKNLTTNVVYE